MDAPRAQRGERYEIGETLGHGGMGVVYAAWDRKRGHDVALKRLTLENITREADTARAKAQFEREYHMLSQLAHPHVIEVYDYGLDAAGPCYTMERLRGASLRALAPLAWPEACRVLREVASALALVHSRRWVHRDITPLNIYCTSAGSAKLIDFGAMMPAGVAAHIVGTPAFIAPECLKHAALDGQTDLFSLGATLYFVLTGEHAYPTRGLASLPESWMVTPGAPSELRPGIPAELDQLVLALLALDPGERPRSAAEVYERLTAIADLPRDERSEIGLAYLSKPALVGRADELAAIRHSIELAQLSHGASLLVYASGGLGRSRLLDAAVLEAKLRGLSVARADGLEGPSVPGAVLRRLFAGMLDEAPELRACADELGIAELAGSSAREFLDRTGRERVLDQLNEWLARACATQTWALAIDDVHAIDELSLAFLSSLALQARSRRLVLFTSVEAEAASRAGGATALLEQASRKLRLGSLDAHQCRELLSSLFGEVPNLDLLAALSQSVCEGKPRAILGAAERLIELGLVRYRDGSFSISGDREALSEAVVSAGDHASELAQLPRAARELLELLALDVDAITSFADYPGMLEATDAAPVHAALSELISKGWLEASPERARFRRDDRRRAVAAGLAPERRRQLHARLAERCEQLPISKIYAAHHYVHAGAVLPAVEMLDTFWRDTENRLEPEILRQPVCLDTFEAATRLPIVEGVHPALHAHHAVGAAMNMLLRGMPERVAPQLPAVLRGLAPFSGVADYAELSGLSGNERVTQALTRAHARCDVPGKGGLPDVFRALRRQAQISIGSAITAFMMNDPQLFELIPDLRPFSALAAPLNLVARLVEGISRITRGRIWEALDVFRGVLADLRGPLAGQVDTLTTLALSRTTIGFLGRMSAEFGSAECLAWIDEDSALRPDTAESSRAIYWLAQGDLARADLARRRSEVLAAQAGSNADTRVVELQAHLGLFALCDDVLGLRRTQQALQQVTATRPHWRVRAELARVHALRCQGAVERALGLIERVLRDEGQATFDWHACASAQLDLLNAARRHAQVVQLGEAYARAAASGGTLSHRIQLALARGHAELGRSELAEQHLSLAAAELEQHAAGGVVLAQLHEVGARLALIRGNGALFGERLQRWGEFVRRAKHPQLVARYNGLVREAAAAGTSVDGSGGLVIDDARLELEALRELAFDGADDATFYQRLLEAVLEQSGAVAGVLYAVTPEGPKWAAQAGESVFEGALDDAVARYGSLDDSRGELPTGSTQSSAAELAVTHPLTRTGHSATMLRLEHVHEGVRELQAVLVLDLGPSPRPLRVGLEGFAAIIAERARF